MGSMDKKMHVDTFLADDVKSLALRITAAGVRTEKAAGGEIRVEASNLEEDRYTCELTSGRLVVAYRTDGIVNLPRFGGDQAEIVLYLPAGLSLEDVVLEVGAGSMDMDTVPLSCASMDVEIGAGKWRAAHLSVAGRLNVEIGAGKAKMKDIMAGSLVIDCGVGSSTYKGRVGGDIKVDCGVGSCRFQLANKESDFNYDVSCAVGSVTINGSRLRSFASRRTYRNESALGTVALECGIGSIELRTEDVGMGFEK